MTARYRIRHNDGPESVEIDGRMDLTLAEVQGVISERRYYFDQANNPEPYAAWGLSVVEVIYDEDGVIETPIDWRTLDRVRADIDIGYGGRRERKFRFHGDNREIHLEISARLADDLLTLLNHDQDKLSRPLIELRDLLRRMEDE